MQQFSNLNTQKKKNKIKASFKLNFKQLHSLKQRSGMIENMSKSKIKSKVNVNNERDLRVNAHSISSSLETCAHKRVCIVIEEWNNVSKYMN